VAKKKLLIHWLATVLWSRHHVWFCVIAFFTACSKHRKLTRGFGEYTNT